ncbi:WGS project CABT00000000 data, contig 2.4, related [Eimeria maxima]|uniref:WGS project CABT00000000 data, contig 2.4, related n=1 Tax=Eimeria maxima TaxID=5804 RepID=U6M305_EIMMA|nr:WGS project CABT00000000 data, contig 2.4, related [Eimeria maxima]CDJ56829.1 WGS project CABT00000000 data, contig 2.4, related [Eimeria maxima]
MEGGDSAAGPDRQTVPFMSPVPNTIGNPQLGGPLVGAPIQGGPPVEDSLQDSDTNGYSMHAQQRGDSYEKRIHRGPPRGPPLVYELPVIEPKNRGAPHGGPQGLPQVPSNGAPQGASQPLPQLYEGPPGAPRVYGAPQDGQGPQGFTYEYSPQGPTGVSLGASNV